MTKRYPKGASPINPDIMLDAIKLWETARMAGERWGGILPASAAQAVILTLVEQGYMKLEPTIGDDNG